MAREISKFPGGYIDKSVFERNCAILCTPTTGNSRMWRKAPSRKLQIILKYRAIEIPSQKNPKEILVENYSHYKGL